MKAQDKEAEMAVGSGTPEDEWLEDSGGYQVRKVHLELLGLIPSRNQLIFDAGCGPGTYGLMLAAEDNKVVGVEISRESTEVARDRAQEKRVSFSPLVGDLDSLPFKDNSFDICFCGWVLHHFPDASVALSELVRVLKPGGKIALAEPNESNLAVRFSRFVEDLPIVRGWVLGAGWDTPNRTVHKHKYYIEALRKQGITDIELNTCFGGGLPPLPPKSRKAGLSLFVIHALVRLRRLLFAVAGKILPRPLNGAELLITGTKWETKSYSGAD